MARSLLLLSGATTLSFLTLSGTALAVDCFVDSVAGSDTNDGLSEAKAVQSTAKIPSTCTVVQFKRGSEFKLAKGAYVMDPQKLGKVTMLTNYGDASQPLPKFTKDHVDGSGGMIQSYTGNLTIDGLYLAGSKSANSMGQLADGIGVMLGGNSVLKNCEITACDIGIMTSGDNVKVLNNYVHDLSISVDAAPGVDPNAVGGAEGIFVNSSHVEVAYNRFINCSTAAQWVSNTNGGGVRCDGGATEVTVKYAGEVTDVNIHHNFSYNSCGFFEISSMFQDSSSTGAYVKGKFTNSVFHDNVMIDSGWISLLQVNNTRLTNVRWENNTIVHHDMGTTTGADGKSINLNDFGSSAIQAIAFNSTSSGVTGGGEISPGDIFWTNNLWYFDPKVKPYNLVDPANRGSDALLANITVTGDLVVTTDPGFKDITSKSDPTAYDLVAGSAAIDKGVTNANITADITTDFVGRARPVGAAYDLGAFEYDASAGGATGWGGAPAEGGVSSNPVSTGGAKAAGGATSVTPATSSVGGAKAAGGAVGVGGGAVVGLGGAKAAGGGVSTSKATGGSGNTGAATSTVASPSAGGSASTNSAAPINQGGMDAQGGSVAAQPEGGQAVASSSNPASAKGGQDGAATTPGSSADPAKGGNASSASASGDPVSVQDGGCACRVAGPSSKGTFGAGILALGALLLRRTRRRRA